MSEQSPSITSPFFRRELGALAALPCSFLLIICLRSLGLLPQVRTSIKEFPFPSLLSTTYNPLSCGLPASNPNNPSSHQTSFPSTSTTPHQRPVHPKQESPSPHKHSPSSRTTNPPPHQNQAQTQWAASKNTKTPSPTPPPNPTPRPHPSESPNRKSRCSNTNSSPESNAAAATS